MSDTAPTDFPSRPRTDATAPAKRPVQIGVAVRDVRLDFFRGLAMFIILVAHIPFNRLSNYIPARYGWSDAAEIFVFCSGMASAIAFGRVFISRGWLMGLARVAFRVWQVYWAHIGLFLAVAATKAAIDLSGIWEAYGTFDKVYIESMGLVPFFENTESGLPSLMTLTYVPNYFDILPMYLVILAMIPAMTALARVDPRLAMGVSVAVWLVAQTGILALPADPWSDREWFFNPFGWQLVFFTGFAFMRGWLPKPPVVAWLILVCVVFLIVSIPFGRWQIWTRVDWVRDMRDAVPFLHSKTDEGILRYLHFLSMAYLGWAAAGPEGANLRARGAGLVARIWERALAIILKVGQQSLAVFVFSMWLAQVLGFLLDFTAERGWWPTLGVNLLGCIMIVGLAYGVAWFKAAPWRSKPQQDG